MEPSPTQMAVQMREAAEATRAAQRRGDEREIRDCLARESALIRVAFGVPPERPVPEDAGGRP